MLGGVSGNGDLSAWEFLKRLYSVAGDQVLLRRRRPAPVRIDPRPPTAGAPESSLGDEEPRRRGHTAVDHRARLGFRPSRQFGINKGPTGQAQMLSRSFRMILNNRSAWNVQRLFWCCGAIRAPPRRAPAASAAARGSCDVRPQPEALLLRVQGLHGRDDPAPGEHHRGAGPGKLHQGLDPELLLGLERARLDLRSAGSTEGPSRPATRRTRLRCSRTATTPSSSGRSTPPETRARSSPGPSLSTPTPRRRPRSPTPTPTRRPTTTPPRCKGTAAAGTIVKLYKTAGCTRAPRWPRARRPSSPRPASPPRSPTTRPRPSAPGRRTRPATSPRARALSPTSRTRRPRRRSPPGCRSGGGGRSPRRGRRASDSVPVGFSQVVCRV